WQKTMASMPAPPPAAVASPTNSAISTTVVFSVSVNGRTVSNYNSGAAVRMPQVGSTDDLIRRAIPIAGAILGEGTTAANFLAILCFGMWMGMTSRSVNTATAKTILFVHVIPWLCITFISAIVVTASITAMSVRSGTSFPTRYFTYYPLFSLAFTSIL